MLESDDTEWIKHTNGIKMQRDWNGAECNTAGAEPTPEQPCCCCWKVRSGFLQVCFNAIHTILKVCWECNYSSLSQWLWGHPLVPWLDGKKWGTKFTVFLFCAKIQSKVRLKLIRRGLSQTTHEDIFQSLFRTKLRQAIVQSKFRNGN